MQFATRRSAEVALSNGKNLNGTELAMSWLVPPASESVETEATAADAVQVDHLYSISPPENLTFSLYRQKWCLQRWYTTTAIVLAKRRKAKRVSATGSDDDEFLFVILCDCCNLLRSGVTRRSAY